MVKIQRAIKVEDELWNQAKDEIDNISKFIRQQLREELDKEKEPPKIDLLDNLGLTTKQKKLLEKILDKNLPLSRTEAGKIARKNKLYTRRDHVKKALSTLSQREEVPIEFLDNKYQYQNFKCKNSGCKTGLNINLLKNNNWECMGCGAKYESI